MVSNLNDFDWFPSSGQTSGHLFVEGKRGGDGEGDPELDAFRLQRSGSHAADQVRPESGGTRDHLA